VEQEGKSTTIANLAVALARAGERVVLVDLDLRRPFLHKFFGIDGPGVTEVVLGHQPLEAALVPIATADPALQYDQNGSNGNGNGNAGQFGGTLDVLAAGPIP